MLIGKIVKSNSHIDYICQIYAPGEVEAENVPKPEDYAFGRFVKIKNGSSGDLIGVIYDTILLNPEFGNLGPRLSTATELEVFSPDYLNEKATLVGIMILGVLRSDGKASQGVPLLSAQVDSQVETLCSDEIKGFHTRSSSINIGYFSLLMAQRNPIVPYLLLKIIDQLESYFPEQVKVLSVLRDNIAWKSKVEVAG